MVLVALSEIQFWGIQLTWMKNLFTWCIKCRYKMFLASHTNILSSAAKFVCCDEKSKFNAMTRNHIFWLTDSDRFCDPMILGQHSQINLTQILYQRNEVYILSTTIYNLSLDKQGSCLKVLSWLILRGIFNKFICWIQVL